MIKKILNHKLLKTGDDHFSEVLQKSFWAFFTLILATGLNFIFELLLARFFGVELFGIFYLVFSVVAILALVGRIGLDRALVRFIPPLLADKSWSRINAFKSTAIMLSLTISLPLALFTYLFANVISIIFFNEPDMSQYLRIFAIAIPSLALIYIYSGLLRGLKISAASIFVERGLIYIFGILVVLISYFIFDIEALYIGMTIATYLIVAIGNLIYKKKIPSTKDRVNVSKITLLKTGIPLLFIVFVGYMTGHLNIMMLGILSNAEDVGVFGAAFKISMLMTIVLTAINTISAAKISELYNKENKNQFKKIVSKTAALSTVLGLPIFLIIIIFSSQLLGLFGDEFVVGSTALVILAFAQMIDLGAGSCAYVLSMTGYERVQSIAIGFVLTLNIIFGLILIPSLGVLGAAISAGLAIIFRNLIFVLMVRRYLGVWSLPFKDIAIWLKKTLLA